MDLESERRIPGTHTRYLGEKKKEIYIYIYIWLLYSHFTVGQTEARRYKGMK